MSPEAVQQIQDVLHRWILTGQALVGSIGALAFVFAFPWKPEMRQPERRLR
jgi:hypothetical protein